VYSSRRVARFDLEYRPMPLTLDPARMLRDDCPHDGIAAASGIGEEHSARVPEAARNETRLDPLPTEAAARRVR
jgi:hypothetical protein